MRTTSAVERGFRREVRPEEMLVVEEAIGTALEDLHNLLIAKVQPNVLKGDI
jgi:hypothetical protein